MLRYNLIKRNNFPNIGNEVISSLPLQMSLYFNAFFFPCWFITVVIMWKIKFECLSHIYRVIVTAVLIGVTVIECLRLYVGYLGNLTEKMPELAGFWMLTLLLQMPLQLFLFVNEETLPQPAERAVQAVMLVLLITELVSGYFALRRASKHQAKRFHLMQFEMSPSHSQHNLSFKED